jgi:transcription elongation factor Elf1
MSDANSVYHPSSSVRFRCACGFVNYFNRNLSNVTVNEKHKRMTVKCAKCGQEHYKDLRRFDDPTTKFKFR